MPHTTVDPVNAPIVSVLQTHGRLGLGLHANEQWFGDPRHLLFSMARYKFVAKMLSGSKHVLEIGCGDGFNSRLVRQEVDMMTLVDIDPLFVKDAQERITAEWSYTAHVHNILERPVPGSFDAIYSLDVLEHIPTIDEKTFVGNAVSSLQDTGVMIIGMPTKESQAYTKSAAETGHVNCKSLPDLKSLMLEYFDNVFMFCMNDEVVHTGYAKLAHYGIALCCGPRARGSSA